MPRFNSTPFQPHNERCPECGCVFFKDEYWKRVCFDCWREANGIPTRSPTRQSVTTGTSLGNLALENAKLRAELATARSLAVEYRNDNIRLSKTILELEQQTRQPIEPDKLKRLIQLCHPDRHDNSKASNEITKWLLTLRK